MEAAAFKSLPAAARTRVIPPGLLLQQFVSMNDTDAALDVGFRRESASTLTHFRKKTSSLVLSRMMLISNYKFEWLEKGLAESQRTRPVGTKSFERDVSSDVSVSIDVVQTGSSNFRADDWIRTSMDPLTRRTPFQSSHIGRQAGTQ